MSRLALLALAATVAMADGASADTPAPDAKRGAQLFRTCIACHSLAPDRNMTGPSLAGFCGRKAGDLKSFERYSPALKRSGLVWDENALAEWPKSPAHFLPNMPPTFPRV